MSKVDFGSLQDERVSVAIPVFVYGQKEDGDPFQELTRALVVDVTGYRSSILLNFITRVLAGSVFSEGPGKAEFRFFHDFIF